MPKKQSTYARTFHTVSYIFLVILFAVAVLFLFRYLSKKDFTPEGLVPASSEVFAIGELNLPILNFKNKDGYFRFDDREYYILNNFPDTGIFSQTDYKSYNLINLDTGSDNFIISEGGYYFLSTESNLKYLIDYFESDGQYLKSNQIYQNLKANKSLGQGYIYIFPDDKTGNVFTGSVMTVGEDSAGLFSFLNKSNVSQNSYGTDRIKLTGKFLPYVSPDRDYAFITTDFPARFESMTEMLALAGGIWTGMMGDTISDLEQDHPISEMLKINTEFVYDGTEIISTTAGQIYYPDNIFTRNYKKYHTGSEVFALIFNENSPLKYLENQTYDDRMLTVFYFE